MINPRANIDLKFGKPLSRIESSKFCESRLLEMKNQICSTLASKMSPEGGLRSWLINISLRLENILSLISHFLKIFKIN